MTDTKLSRFRWIPRNLIANRVTQHRRMAGTRLHTLPHPIFDGLTARLVIKKGDMLLPGQAYHHP